MSQSPQAVQGWFHAANNYADMRREAKHAFLYLQSLSGEKWVNNKRDRPKNGKVDIHGFPPNDASFFSRGRDDPDSLLDVSGIPTFAMTDQGSTWRRLTAMARSPVLFPEKRHSMGRVFQGGLDNKYLVDVMSMLSLRPRLLKSIFLHADITRAIFIISMHKNGTWIKVEVDDFVPCSSDGRPLASTSDFFPYVLWPTILEKAYAKMHVCGATGRRSGGWDILGEGGDAASALVDLTGGIGGAFSCKDVSPDRLFVYLHELQGEALFMCQVDTKQCELRGVNLCPAFPYSINRVTQFESQCYVQLHCGAPMVEDGGLRDSVPYTLLHHDQFTESEEDGFFWIHVLDFHEYFDTIYEVRLVNSGSLGRIDGMPSPRLPMEILPCHLDGNRPMFENIWAFGGTCYPDTTPEFHISVHDAPCEIYVCLSQTDLRLLQKEPGRPFHQSIMLKTYEQIDDKFCSYVCKSAWSNNRDSVVIFAVHKPGRYIIISALPSVSNDGSPVEVRRLILRTYSTTPIQVACHSLTSQLYNVISVPQPGAMKWSLIGASHADARVHDHPLDPDPTEGQGVPLAYTMKMGVA